MKKATTIILAVLLASSAVFAYSTRNVNAITVRNYGSLTLTPPGVWVPWGTHWTDVWDLMAHDLVMRYTIDMNGAAQLDAWDCSYTEVGLRTEGADDFNPGPMWTYQGGCGGWMTSCYGPLYNEKFPPTAEPTLDLDEKFNLAASGARDETDYDCLDPNAVGPKIGSPVNYGVWFDRDGVDPWQATYWGSVDGKTYNTNGWYDVVITYHAIDANLGTMFATVNGRQTGFYAAGWKNAPPDYYPAGLSFKGDMTRMQVFAGIIAPGDGSQYGFTVVHDLTVEGELGAPSPLVADFTYSPPLPVAGTATYFTDTSHGGYSPISTWSWDFNGDNVVDSNAQNPSYVYAAAGDYDVNLTVAGYCPSCGWATIIKKIHVFAAPSVGGEWAPINAVQTAGPWIILALIAIAGVAAGTHRLIKKRL